MQNWVWYLGLTVTSLIITGITLWKKRNPKLIPFYFFLCTIIIGFEYTIFVIFKSYNYYPNVIKDTYFDSILGAIVSDFFSVPSVAFAIAAFQLNFVWMLFASIVFMGIEYVFVKLNIYEHYWWKTIYTGIGLMIHFWIGKQFWKSLLQKPIKIYIRIIALYSSYHTIHGLLFYFLVAQFNLFYFHIGLVSNPSRDHIIVQVIYIMIIAFISSLIVGLSLKWYHRILGIMCIYGFDWLLLKVNILNLSSNFSINKFLIAHLSVLVIIVIFNSILIEKLE